MNFLREQVLSSSAFTENQNGGVGGSDALRHFKNATHARRRAEHSAELALSDELVAEFLVFRAKLGQPHEIRDALAKFLDIETFHDVVRCAAVERFDGGACGIEGGDDQYGRFVAGLAQLAKKFQAAFVGHDEVQQDQLDMLAREGFAGRFGGVALDDFVAALKRASHSVARGRLVVNDQNRSHAYRIPQRLKPR